MSYAGFKNPDCTICNGSESPELLEKFPIPVTERESLDSGIELVGYFHGRKEATKVIAIRFRLKAGLWAIFDGSPALAVESIDDPPEYCGAGSYNMNFILGCVAEIGVANKLVIMENIIPSIVPDMFLVFSDHGGKVRVPQPPLVHLHRVASRPR